MSDHLVIKACDVTDEECQVCEDRGCAITRLHALNSDIIRTSVRTIRALRKEVDELKSELKRVNNE